MSYGGYEDTEATRSAAVNGAGEGGRWVRITPLTPAAGHQKLNGKVGKVLVTKPRRWPDPGQNVHIDLSRCY
jgi:hypothetical protein